MITPQLTEQKFVKNKNRNTIRLVCLGGSTTAGFPYEVNINFPYFIKSRLQWLFPNKNIEVINLGISAINSHAVLDFLPEVLKLNPDAVLIYMGHNEFYGALGLASIESIGSNRTFIKFYLELKEFRTYQLVRTIVWNLLNFFKSDSNKKQHGTLMKEIISQSQISYKSELYNKTIENFHYNLEDVVDFLTRNKVPILISDVVSNIKDQPPLGQDEILIQNGDIRRQLQKAKTFKNDYDFQLAKKTYEEILLRDSTIASVLYNYAKCLYNLSEFKKAKKFYLKARDYDVMRFRAPKEINAIIKEVCLNKNAIFVSSDSIFQSNSEHGIAGKSLFLEHLHPNVKGCYLIASSFIEGLKKSEIFCIKDKWPIKREKTTEEYLLDSGYTILDVIIGELIIKGLIEDFPFNGKSSFEPTPVDNEDILRIAKEHHVKQIYWDEAHYKLGKQYEIRKQFLSAQREYESVQKVIPENYLPYFKLGDLYYKQKDWVKAIEFYRISMKYNSNYIYTHAKLGKTFILADQNINGINELEQVFKMENKQPILNSEAKLELNYLLGLGYARLGKYDDAVKYLNMALKINLKYHPAVNLLSQIQKEAQ
ncbi:MAG: hypothetical protein KAS18_09855 [Calditrichia bacterium]|nr:hypothetical protein [Calditrichia bacterium]